MGRIDRAHGLAGEVVVRLLSNNPERLAAGAGVVVDVAGEQRRLTVSASRPHQDRHLVVFEGVLDRSGAESLAGATLLAEAVTGDAAGYWVHDLIGAEVFDADGAARGTVVSVVANPASDLLELDSGVLVPLRFATWIGGAGPGEARPPRLEVDGPAGLFGDEA